MIQDVEKWIEDRIILKVYKGSHAYGTNHPASDVDIGGICIPPKAFLYGFHSFEQYESKKYTQYPGYAKKKLPADTVIYGLHKFVKLAFDCNPNIIETLYTDRTNIVYCNSLGRMLIDNRNLFLTRRARHTFGGYAFSQLRRLTNKLPMEDSKNKISRLSETGRNLKIHLVRIEHRVSQYFQKEHLTSDDIQEILNLRSEMVSVNQRLMVIEEERAGIEAIVGGGNHNHHGSHAGLIERYGYDVKHAMHLIRLLHMGLEILTEGECRVLRPDNNYLLSIRQGEYSLDQIKEEAEKLFSLLDEAYVKSKLPDSPDIERVNQLLIDITEASLDDLAWKE